MDRNDFNGLADQASENQWAGIGPQIVTKAEYDAAIAEFDRLWETGAGKREPDKMKRLLAVIESFETEQGHGRGLREQPCKNAWKCRPLDDRSEEANGKHRH